MSYLALARKYRPQKFDEVLGQKAIASTLANAIRNSTVGHAYLFVGPRGVGKTSMARIFAKNLTCPNTKNYEACNKCDLCKAVSLGQDVDVIEIDGASNNTVDDIRQLRENTAYTPVRAPFRIYIIDEVHMVSKAGFNALLKTLEEPPAHVKFIFATTEPHKIPATILSRVQRFDFNSISNDSIIERLQQIAKAEEISLEEKAASIIAVKANGGMRDAQSLLDQAISFCGSNVTSKDVLSILGRVDETEIMIIANAISEKNLSLLLTKPTLYMSKGLDLTEIANQLLSHFRNLLLVKNCASTEMGWIELEQKQIELAIKQAQLFTNDALVMIIEIINKSILNFRNTLHHQLILEIALTKASSASDLVTIGELVNRIEQFDSSTPTTTQPKQQPERPSPSLSNSSVSMNPATTSDLDSEMLSIAPAIAKSTVKKEKETTMQVKQDKLWSPEEFSLKRKWDQINKSLKAKDKILGAFFREVRFCGIENDSLHLGISKEFPVHKEKLEEFDNRKKIVDVIESVIEKRYTLAFGIVEAEEDAGEKLFDSKLFEVKQEDQRDNMMETATNDPMVREAINIFDGRIVEVSRSK